MELSLNRNGFYVSKKWLYVILAVVAGIWIAAETHTPSFSIPERNPEILYCTYTVHLKDGTVYSGYTSTVLVPTSEQTYLDIAEIAVSSRLGSGKHTRIKEIGIVSFKLDKISFSYYAIRGREQQLIDFHGGAVSDGGTSANLKRGAARGTAEHILFHNAANKEFGQLAPM